MAKKILLIATLLLLANCLLPTLVFAQVTQLWGMAYTGGQSGIGVIFNTDSSGNNESVQQSFYATPGALPQYTNLIQATDGNLYGMTYNGGVNNDGILFQFNPTTSVLTKEIDFAGASNGANPCGSLIQASDGNLYGMTYQGGANGNGVLFQYNLSTSILTVKINFLEATIGAYPYGSLMQASGGNNLYGMTETGGANDEGVLFQYNIATSVLTKKIDFAGTSNGSNPYGSLMQASDANLYGMTASGGANGDGILFQYNPTTSAITDKIDFAGASNGAYPYGSLKQASNGNLYGMTTQGGANDEGVLFQYKLATSALTVEINFAGASNGANPYGSLMQASDSNLYAMTASGGANGDGVLFQFNPSTSVLTKKIDFAGASNGTNPEGSLMQASNGNLYGMTETGGLSGEGVLFQYNLTTSILTKQINFAGASNGDHPLGSLMLASDGNLYGMTEAGGANDDGVLFQLNPSTSVLTKRIDFAGASNGNDPYGSLMQASDGNLYGMTQYGGANGDGVLFQYNLTTSVLTKKIDFAGASNGANPLGSLMQASDGNLYGMTEYGGANGRGALFQYNPSTSVLTKKIDFAGASNGKYPNGSLMQASDGNLYGMTLEGGANGDGVLFQYNLATSVLTKKIDFAGSNGEYPYYGPLIEASDGNLYGMAEEGGIYSDGVLFQYNLSTSVLTVKINFAGASNGLFPTGSLMQASDGNLYGMTSQGGANGDGVLFQYNLATAVLTKKIDFAGTTNGANPYGSLIENPPVKVSFNLSMFIQGYYQGKGLMTPVLYNEGIDPNPSSTKVDTITVSLVDSVLLAHDPHDNSTDADVVATAKGLLQTNGSLSVTFPASVAGNKYYLMVTHRNALQTWSVNTIFINNGGSYDFTTRANKAYGNNEVDVYKEGIWSFYSGDMNQDQNIDIYDFPICGLESSQFDYGYYVGDLNGDGNVDIYDFPVYDANSASFIYSVHP